MSQWRRQLVSVLQTKHSAAELEAGPSVRKCRSRSLALVVLLHHSHGAVWGEC